MGRYHSFGELRHGLHEVRQERFAELLAGKFDQVPTGNFSTTLEGVESISLTRPAGEHAQSLAVTLFTEREPGSFQSYTFSLFADGTLSGEIPKALRHLSREAILDEVLRIVGELDLDAVVQINGDILPPGTAVASAEVGAETESAERRRPARVDLRRLHHMERQQDLLFYFVSQRDGFDGYHGFVFPWGIVLEHPKAENAAYFIDFPSPVPVDEEQFRRPLGQRLPQSDRWQLLRHHWKPFENLSKGEAIELGAQAKRHLPGDRWIEQMEAELEQRRGQLQAV